MAIVPKHQIEPFTWKYYSNTALSSAASAQIHINNLQESLQGDPSLKPALTSLCDGAVKSYSYSNQTASVVALAYLMMQDNAKFLRTLSWWEVRRRQNFCN